MGNVSFQGIFEKKHRVDSTFQGRYGSPTLDTTDTYSEFHTHNENTWQRFRACSQSLGWPVASRASMEDNSRFP